MCVSNTNVAYIYILEHEVPVAGGDALSMDQISDAQLHTELFNVRWS